MRGIGPACDVSDLLELSLLFGLVGEDRGSKGMKAYRPFRSAGEFAQAVQWLRAGKPAKTAGKAAERLWHAIEGWIKSCKHLQPLLEGDPTLTRAATSHVLEQLWRGKWIPALSRDLNAVKKWVIWTAKRHLIDCGRRRYKVQLRPFGTEGHDPEDTRQLPDQDLESQSGKMLKQLCEELQRIDEIVRQALELESLRLDWVAVYALEGRIGLYNLLRRLDRPVSRPSVWSLAVQNMLPWSARDERRRIKAGGPCIGDIWRSLRQRVGVDSPSMTIRGLIEAVNSLTTGAGASPNLYYKWCERLREKLREMLARGLLADIDPDAVTVWCWIYGLQPPGSDARP